MLIYLTRGLTAQAAASFLGCNRAACQHSLQVLCLSSFTSWGLSTMRGVSGRGGWLPPTQMKVNGSLQWDPWKLWEGNCYQQKPSLGSFFQVPLTIPVLSSVGWNLMGGSPERRLGWNKLSNIHTFHEYPLHMLSWGGEEGLGIIKGIKNNSCFPFSWVMGEKVDVSKDGQFCYKVTCVHLKIMELCKIPQGLWENGDRGTTVKTSPVTC